MPFAITAAIRAHRAARFDALYSTSSPVTAHLVAGTVKRLTGVPWVAEFRDPWVGSPLAEPLPWLHRRLQSRIERWIVHSANQLVFLSPSTARVYRRRYPHAAAMAVITNGHDATEVIERQQTNTASDRYRIVWTGALYRPAELAMFLEAIKVLVGRRPALGDTLAVDFFGHVSGECRTIADRFSHDGSLAGVLRFHGFVSRRAALQEVADADAALVMLGGETGVGQFVPGKLFDYLGQSKQVLAVLPPGDARDILEELNWGVIADPDVEQIGYAIERLIELPAPDRRADPEGRYDRAILAGRLADTLRAATGDGRDGGSPSAT